MCLSGNYRHGCSLSEPGQGEELHFIDGWHSWNYIPDSGNTGQGGAAGNRGADEYEPAVRIRADYGDCAS